jgi:chromosome segregation ATPase
MEPNEQTPTENPTTEGGENPNVDLAALTAERDQLRSAAQTAEEARAALELANAESSARAEQLAAQVAALSEQATNAQRQALEAHRRALLAEHQDVIPELVAGDTVEALTASIETARAAHARVVEGVRGQPVQLPSVPTGTSTSSPPPGAVESLSPLARITAALTGGRNGQH